jgi:hypothetical protein
LEKQIFDGLLLDKIVLFVLVGRGGLSFLQAPPSSASHSTSKLSAATGTEATSINADIASTTARRVFQPFVSSSSC